MNFWILRVFTDAVRVVLITGISTGGIGAETVITFASANPKKIILAARTEAKVRPYEGGNQEDQLPL